MNTDPAWITALAAAVIGFITGLLADRYRRSREPIDPAGLPAIVQCGNCGMPTSAFCIKHRTEIKAGLKIISENHSGGIYTPVR